MSSGGGCSSIIVMEFGGSLDCGWLCIGGIVGGGLLLVLVVDQVGSLLLVCKR